jgi:GNAT superfamily N-acetyltransferase
MDLGLGTYLIRWAIQRAHHVIEKVPADARVAVRSYSEQKWTPAINLFEAHQYTPIRHFFQMRIDMDAPPPTPIWPEGISLQNCRIPDDLEPYFRAVDEAFQDHFGHVDEPFEQAFEQFKHRRLRDEGFDPNLWFQAMDGDQVAGFCLGRKWGWESKEHGYINLLGVRRPWRKRGLGLALLHHIFNVYWGRGQKSVSLGVDADSLTGAVRLYEKAGMHVHRQYTTYELEIRPGIELAKTGAEGSN